MNRKVLISAAIGAIGVAVLVAGYFISSGGQQRALQYVPADTALFAGSVKPVDFRKYLETSQWAVSLLDLTKGEMEKLEEAAKNNGPFTHFLMALYVDYLDQFRKGPDQVLAHYGFSEKSESALYLVGAVPVLRTYVRDPAAFVKAVEAAEKKSGFTPKIEKAGDMQLRRYPAKNAEADKAGLDLIIATGADVVVVTIDSPKLDDKTRAVALGQQKPATSLAAGKLAKLAKAHGLNDDGVYYIDFVEISKSLVDPKNTLLGQHLQLAFGDMPTLAGIQTAACQKEIPEFVANVPRLVGGLKTYKTSSTGLDMTVVYDLEIANPTLLKALSDLRGVLPKHLLATDNAPIAWFGLGLDTDKVASTITTLVQDFGAQKYQCEPLLTAQKSVTSQNLAGLAVLGMARGVKGMSVAGYSFDIATVKSGSFAGLDAIATISAPDPMVLWQMAAGFLPPVTVPKNGDPVDVPLPTGGTVKVALKGSHLVAYVGDKSAQAAQQLKGQDLTPNGMFGYGYDYSLFGQFASLAKTSTDKDAEMEKLFKGLAGLKVNLVSDFNAMGWRNEIVIHIPKPKAAPST